MDAAGDPTGSPPDPHVGAMTYGEFVKFAADETRQMRAAAAETKAAEKTARAAARAEEKLAMKRAIGEVRARLYPGGLGRSLPRRAMSSAVLSAQRPSSALPVSLTRCLYCGHARPQRQRIFIFLADINRIPICLAPSINAI